MPPCACGCQRDARRRFLPGHNSRLQQKSPVELRFWAKIGKVNTEQCWVWQASKYNRGYGCFTITSHNQVSAHRYSYQLLRGPIPAGLELDHLCRNTSCVNPWHLEAVTHQVNMQRGDGVARENFQKATCKNGHPYDVRYTRKDGRVERFCRQCRRHYHRRYAVAYRARKSRQKQSTR